MPKGLRRIRIDCAHLRPRWRRLVFITQRANTPQTIACVTGNIHAMILYHNEEEEKIGRELQTKMVYYALELDGTCQFESTKTFGK
jgi:hypothetical protein